MTAFEHGKVIAHGTPAELKHVVGGQTVLVRPADHARLRESIEIISAVAGRPAESPGRDVTTVPVEGDAAFTEIVARLDAAGIAVTESARLATSQEGRPRAGGPSGQSERTGASARAGTGAEGGQACQSVTPPGTGACGSYGSRVKMKVLRSR
ncbi:hypothetical protein AB0L53_52645 [Nonomuraea sp. NPDC052129]|uniref:hypothetical protein n=1 Tax=Nonomuraea sp. NPDC052129 TaxID=3154651 RepID=UPI00342539F5